RKRRNPLLQAFYRSTRTPRTEQISRNKACRLCSSSQYWRFVPEHALGLRSTVRR
ncbi:unnamed protein product, partial [Pylaiella littoralis]